MTPQERARAFCNNGSRCPVPSPGPSGPALETTLREIQSSKAALREPLAEAWRGFKSAAPPVPRSARALPFRIEVARLIALEDHNARLLAVRREKACEQQHLLERAVQNLRNIRRSSGPPSPPVACNSYS